MLKISGQSITVSEGDTFVIPFAITNHIVTSSETVTMRVRKYSYTGKYNNGQLVLGTTVYTKSLTSSDAKAIKDTAGNTVGSQLCYTANKTEAAALTQGNYLYDLILETTTSQIAIIPLTAFNVLEVTK